MEAITDPTGKQRRDRERALDRCMSKNSPFGEAMFDLETLKVLRTNKKFRDAFDYRFGMDLDLEAVVHRFLPGYEELIEDGEVSPEQGKEKFEAATAAQRHPSHIRGWIKKGCPDLTLGMRGHTNLQGRKRDGGILNKLLIEVRADQTDEIEPMKVVMAWIIFPGTFGN